MKKKKHKKHNIDKKSIAKNKFYDDIDMRKLVRAMDIQFYAALMQSQIIYLYPHISPDKHLFWSKQKE